MGSIVYPWKRLLDQIKQNRKLLAIGSQIKHLSWNQFWPSDTLASGWWNSGSVANNVFEGNKGYCQLKSNWADFLPRASNLNAEQSMSYEFVYGLIFGQIHLT